MVLFLSQRRSFFIRTYTYRSVKNNQYVVDVQLNPPPDIVPPTKRSHKTFPQNPSQDHLSTDLDLDHGLLLKHYLWLYHLAAFAWSTVLIFVLTRASFVRERTALRSLIKEEELKLKEEKARVVIFIHNENDDESSTITNPYKL